MTQRSILAGTAPKVIIKTGTDIVVRGVDGEWVTAESTGRWGLEVKRTGSGIEVKVGGGGQVKVPLHCDLKVYAGKTIEVHQVRGEVTAYAGKHLTLAGVLRLANASAGGTMDIDCETIAGEAIKLSAGGNLRIHIRELISANIRVHDLGGHWDARIGDGKLLLNLSAGGDVTLVTDQEVQALPPNYILGTIENPTQNYPQIFHLNSNTL